MWSYNLKHLKPGMRSYKVKRTSLLTNSEDRTTAKNWVHYWLWQNYSVNESYCVLLYRVPTTKRMKYGNLGLDKETHFFGLKSD